MKSFFRNLRHIISILLQNKLRTALLWVGFIIISVAFSAGDVITSNMMLTSAVKYQNFPNNAILLQGSFDKTTLSLLYRFDKNLKSTPYYVNGYEDSIKLAEPQLPPLKVNAFQVTSGFKTYPILSADTSDSLEKTVIIAGRDFNDEDNLLNRKVAIIHSSVAKLLFSDNQVIGKEINLETGGYYTVVGILKDTPDILRIMKTLKNENRSVIPIYILNHQDNYNAAVCLVSGAVGGDYISSLKNYFIEQANVHVTCYTAQLHNDSILQNLRDAKLGLMILLAVMYFVCFAFISAIMLFFVKERVVEIGIRKAIGAREKDITFQFVVEMLITSLIASLIGTILGLSIGSVISLLLTAKIGVVHVQIGVTATVLPCIISLLVALLASLIPSYIASKITIRECLQFE